MHGIDGRDERYVRSERRIAGLNSRSTSLKKFKRLTARCLNDSDGARNGGDEQRGLSVQRQGRTTGAGTGEGERVGAVRGGWEVFQVRDSIRANAREDV